MTPDTPTGSNLAVMRTLVGEIAAELKGRYADSLSDTVILQVDSSSTAWIVRSEMASILASGGKKVLTTGEPGRHRTRWAVHGVRLEVSYPEIRKPGIFSEALVDREIRAECTAEIWNSEGLLGSQTISRISRDTVRENEVELLESRELEFTKGAVPDLDSWDRFVEPFVIIGAAGTAIFLFFQVRS